MLPARRDIDARLIVGSVIFGAGWGLVGLCPGPAVAALGVDGAGAVVFVLAMLAGMAGYYLTFQRAGPGQLVHGSAAKAKP
jgi:uncharacterized membrane protein YedE/YeeE